MRETTVNDRWKVKIKEEKLMIYRKLKRRKR